MAVDSKKHFIIPTYKRDPQSGDNLFEHVKKVLGVNDTYSREGGVYERNVPIVPNCIEQQDNEIIVKQYNICKLRTRLEFKRAEGRLMVTNKRVLFRAAGNAIRGNTLQEHEFNLDEIAGVQLNSDYKFSFLSFLGAVFVMSAGAGALFYLLLLFSRSWGTLAAGMLLGLLGLATNALFYKGFWLKTLCSGASVGAFMSAAVTAPEEWITVVFYVFAGIAGLALIVNWILVSFVPRLEIIIKTKGASPAVDIAADKLPILFIFGEKKIRTGFAEVLPWEDTVMAINELGTMIDDLQKLGDYAVEKWTQ